MKPRDRTRTRTTDSCTIVVRTINSRMYESTTSLPAVSLPCLLQYGSEGVAVLVRLQLPRYSYTRVQQHICVLATACLVPGTWQSSGCGDRSLAFLEDIS